MSKERTPEEVYDDLVTKGLYEETHFDKDEVAKVKKDGSGRLCLRESSKKDGNAKLESYFQYSL